jgi:hypothetical protein
LSIFREDVNGDREWTGQVSLSGDRQCGDHGHGAATLAHLAGTDLKTISDQLGHSSIALTADTHTSVLPAAQYKAAETTARLVLDAAREFANVRGIASHAANRPGSSQFTGRQPDTRGDHRPRQPLGNHMTTTVHTELNEQPYPLLRGARPKRFELPTF